MSLEHCERCDQPHPRCHHHKKHTIPLVPCMAWPRRGQVGCKSHGGGAPQVKAAADRRVAMERVQREVRQLGSSIKVTNVEAMQAMVHEAYGNVVFYRSLVQQLEQGGRLVGDHDAEDVVSAIGGEENPRASIAGRVDPKNLKAEPHVLVAMYDAERERLVRWCKANRDAGVDEGLVALAEKQGEMLAKVLRVLLESVLGALVSAGAPEPVVRQVWSSEVPGLVRRALGEAGGEVA